MSGYRVTVLSDWTLLCVSEAAILQSDPDNMRDAIARRFKGKWPT